MPNHITNRITMSGNKEEIIDILVKYGTYYGDIKKETHDNVSYICDDSKGNFVGWLNKKTNEFEWLDKKKDKIKGLPKGFKIEITPKHIHFPDFEKIFPMPKELHISCDQYASFLDDNFSKNDLNMLIDRIKKEESKEERISSLIKGITNKIKYDSATWYKWSCKNWGTKWNSYSCERIGIQTFKFETAWSGVPKIIDEIHNNFPKVKIIYEWSDEDIGFNCGKIIYDNNDIKIFEFEKGGKESYELAFELHPDSKEHYKLINGKYEYIEEE